VNATDANFTEIQKALPAAGFYSGPIDGDLGSDGYLTVETVTALWISPQ